MKLENSVNWSNIQADLHRKAQLLSHKNDLHKMIDNISFKVTQLSKAEVEARQGRPHKAQELLKEVNNDIELVEEYLLVAALLG